MEIVYIGAKTRPAVQGTTRGKHVLAGIAHTFSLCTLSVVLTWHAWGWQHVKQFMNSPHLAGVARLFYQPMQTN